jgi:hypothetical protein
VSSSLKRKLTFAIVGLAVVALAGGAYAATQNSGATSRQAFLNDVAKRLNVTPQQLRSALQGAYFDRLDAQVAAGKLTLAQANAIKKRLQQGGIAPLGLGPAGTFPAYRFGGPVGPSGVGPRGFGFGMLGGVGGQFAAAAAYLGITTSNLLSDVHSGKSLARIATAHGKTASGLESAISAAIKARLDKAVASKMITSAQEQKLLSNLSSVLSAIVSRMALVPPPGKPGFRGPFRFFRRPPARFWKGGGAGGKANRALLVPLFGGGPLPAGKAGAPPPAGP